MYKVWNAAENMEYNANVSYQVGSGNWGAILTVVSDLAPVYTVVQDIQLDPYTFNMMSVNVYPETDELAYLFNDISLLLVKNDASDYYVPSFGVDQIGVWNKEDGYKVFLDGAGAQWLSVEGMPLSPDVTVGLEPYTMNILPYVPQDCMPTDQVFAGYEDHILIVKNDESDYYVPSFGVQTLAEMCPGEGYAVFLSSADGMDFMYPMGGLASYHGSSAIADYKLRTRTNDVAQTGESHLVLLTDISGEVQAGDQLRAYANGELVGSINIIPEHIDGTYPIDLVAVGGVDLSMYDGPELFGYTQGDAIEVRLYSSARGIELKTIASLDSDAYGNAMEMSVGSAVVLDESAIATSVSLSQNYPNPFNPSTTIAYNVEQSGHVTLNVYDVMGRLVKTLVNDFVEAGNSSGYQVVWDGLDNNGQQVSAGLYIYSLQTQGMTMTQKMVLMK